MIENRKNVAIPAYVYARKKRKRVRMYIIFKLFHFSFSVDPSLLLKEKGPTKIDCGLKEVDAGKYKRNYYINQSKAVEKSKFTHLRFHISPCTPSHTG